MDRIFKVEMQLENAAFSERPGVEIARILRELANRVEDSDLRDMPKRLMDINGDNRGYADPDNDPSANTGAL